MAKDVWSSVVMVKNYTFTIDQFWPFFFDRSVQMVQLRKVDIQINLLVPWKQLKKYDTFPIPQDSIIFFLCNLAFDVFCGGSSRLEDDPFQTTLL